MSIKEKNKDKVIPANSGVARKRANIGFFIAGLGVACCMASTVGMAVCAMSGNVPAVEGFRIALGASLSMVTTGMTGVGWFESRFDKMNALGG